AAWSGEETTGRALLEALSAKDGQPLPWTLVGTRSPRRCRRGCWSGRVLAVRPGGRVAGAAARAVGANQAGPPRGATANAATVHCPGGRGRAERRRGARRQRGSESVEQRGGRPRLPDRGAPGGGSRGTADGGVRSDGRMRFWNT